MNTTYKNWFDYRDLEAPFKVIAELRDDHGDWQRLTNRFSTLNEALKFISQCPKGYIASHHDYTKKTTRIIAYKFK